MRPTEFISAFRKGKPAPAYFLRGPDRFLHETCRQALVDAVPSEARTWCLMEIEYEPERLAKALEGANQMPMLGGHSYFLISDSADFRHATDNDSDALQAYLERPSPFATVVFSAVEPDRRRRFIQLLEKKATVVELRPLARREAAAWAKDFLRQAGIEVDLELAEEIASKFESTNDRDSDRSGVNLLWMRTELEKILMARSGAKRLEQTDLELMVAFREERQISKLLRALADRNCGEALDQLRALLSSKTAETLILWCITDLFRQTLKLASSLRSGAGQGAVPYGAGRGAWNRPGSPFSTYEVASLAVKKFSREELLQGLRLARRTDLNIKSSWKDSRILMEFLVWQITVGKGSETGPVTADEMAAPSAEA